MGYKGDLGHPPLLVVSDLERMDHDRTCVPEQPYLLPFPWPAGGNAAAR
jgi:hypothetical protein